MASDASASCGQQALIGYRIGGDDGHPLGCALAADGHQWHYDRAEDITWQRGTPEECQASVSCQLPGDCVNGPEPHPFIPPLPDVDLPCCRQPWEALDRAAMPGQPGTGDRDGYVVCQLPGDCPNGPEPHAFIAPVGNITLPCCRQPWEARDA